MNHNLYLLLLLFLFPIHSFGQDIPEPNLETETYNKRLEEWNFKLKPYKKITSFKQGNLSQTEEFDTSGRRTEISTNSKDYISSVSTTYKDGMMVEVIHRRRNKSKPNPSTSFKDQTQVFKINFDKDGKIIDGESLQAADDSIFKTMGRLYYDKKNRLIKVIDIDNGHSSTNYSYSGDNLIQKEIIYQTDPKNKTTTVYNYKYNSNNQPIFLETSTNKYIEDIIVDKKISSTITVIYKGKLLVQKILKDNSTTVERNYTYDKDKNLIFFIEKKTNNANEPLYEKWRKNKYENKLLVYSQDFDGSSSHRDGKEGYSYYEYSNGLLHKITRTYDVARDRKAETEYSYNEFNHLIKVVSTFLDLPNPTITEYQIEYY